jgi:purine nucleosidase
LNATVSRRKILAGGLGLSAVAVLHGTALSAGTAAHRPARMRVVVDNDLGGDPDGLFQLAHFALSPSVHIPFVLGTQYKDFGPADLLPDKARASADKAAQLLKLVPGGSRIPVLAGSARPLISRGDKGNADACAAIVHEAMRTDTATPLYYAAGGSLTEIARAWLAEPAIGRRLRLVWIGGAEHPGLANPPPGLGEPEYNFSLDRLAAQIVFNESDIEIWQVPRNAFRQMLIGLAELETLRRGGPLGRYLSDQVGQAQAKLAGNLPAFIYDEGETINLGDSALVTLTALQSAFQPDSSSSSYALLPTPHLAEDGSYRPYPQGRMMRVYNSIDADLTFRDMLAKLRRG